MLAIALSALLCVGVVVAAPSSTTSAPQADDYPVPQIDWGKCPQLKPTEADKEQKRIVIERCLDQNPPPPLETVTDPKQIDDHREVVTTCALKIEGWFNTDGSYKFDRAKTEIESKKLEKLVERNISRRHQECQQEAVKRFPGGYIQQVQLYQACMDYHIAEICQIELIPPPGGFEGLEGLADYEGELGAAFPEFAGQPIDSANQPQPSPQPASS